jgi:hypothetical protein
MFNQIPTNARAIIRKHSELWAKWMTLLDALDDSEIDVEDFGVLLAVFCRLCRVGVPLDPAVAKRMEELAAIHKNILYFDSDEGYDHRVYELPTLAAIRELPRYRMLPAKADGQWFKLVAEKNMNMPKGRTAKTDRCPLTA